MRLDGRPRRRASAAATRPAAGLVLLLLLLGLIGLSSCASSGDGGESPGDAVTTSTAVPANDDPTGASDVDRRCPDDERQWRAEVDPSANYVDFVQLEVGQFVHAEQDAGILDEPDLGSVIAEVCLALAGITFTEPFDIEPGDAAYLTPGTELREIVGSDPTLRVGAVVDERVRIYEVWDRPDAAVGAQLLDLGANVDEVTISSGSGAVLVAISESDAIDALLAAVRVAPVDQSRPPGPPSSQPEYVIEFVRSDGTTTRRGYRPDSGWLEPSVVVPQEMRLLLFDLIAGADRGVAAGTTTTTEPAADTSTSSSATTVDSSTVPDDDVGLIPEPMNEAEADLRFDFGAIVGTSITDDGAWIQFDRYQLADGRNGTELTQEVQMAGATDLGWANTNTRLRWYRLAPDVEVLELEADWFNRLCVDFAEEVVHAPSSINRLLALDARLVSLTFEDQEVTRIRDQRSC